MRRKGEDWGVALVKFAAAIYILSVELCASRSTITAMPHAEKQTELTDCVTTLVCGKLARDDQTRNSGS